MLGSSKEPNALDYKKVKAYYKCTETESGPEISINHDIDDNDLGINDRYTSERVKKLACLKNINKYKIFNTCVFELGS